MIDVMTFGLDEQETSLAFIRGDDMIEVYSSDSTMITKLKKITDDIEILTTDDKGRITSANFRLTAKQILFRKEPKSFTRTLTEEQIENNRRTLAKAREMK